jgi:hypothetical protein
MWLERLDNEAEIAQLKDQHAKDQERISQLRDEIDQLYDARQEKDPRYQNALRSLREEKDQSQLKK